MTSRADVIPPQRPLLTDDQTRAIEKWLDRRGLGATISSVTKITGGTQNVLLRLDIEDGHDPVVLRRPRWNPTERQNAAIQREATILTALRDTDVPHARLLGSAAQGDIFDDAACYLMEHVTGFNPVVTLPAEHHASPAWRHAMGLSAIDALGAVGGVDYRAAGLDHLATHTQDFAATQVHRWQRQMVSYHRDYPGYRADDLENLDPIAQWLTDNVPTSVDIGLMHGDFHYANLLYAPTSPDVTAIVDWELATVGAPLLDLGWLLITTPVPGDQQQTALSVAGGLPNNAQMVAHYAHVTGRDTSQIDWFTALAGYKMAVILEGTSARAAIGKANPKTAAVLHRMAVGLLRRSNLIVEGEPVVH